MHFNDAYKTTAKLGIKRNRRKWGNFLYIGNCSVSSCVSIEFLHLFDSHHQFSKFTIPFTESFFTENICVQNFVFSCLFSLRMFPFSQPLLFLGFGNDFHISKSYAENEEQPQSSSNSKSVLHHTSPLKKWEKNEFHWKYNNSRKSNLKRRKNKHIEHQIVMHTTQMIATYMHQKHCIKESAKLNANTMDGWMNRKWKFFG